MPAGPSLRERASSLLVRGQARPTASKTIDKSPYRSKHWRVEDTLAEHRSLVGLVDDWRQFLADGKQSIVPQEAPEASAGWRAS